VHFARKTDMSSITRFAIDFLFQNGNICNMNQMLVTCRLDNP
jgi:hypothetical protein